MALGQLVAQPATHRATAGDDWRLGVTLYDDGAALDVSGGTIAVYLLDRNRTRVIGPVEQSSGTTGAAWGTGLVVVAVPSATTDDVPAADDHTLQIQVTKGGVLRTWSVAVTVEGQP